MEKMSYEELRERFYEHNRQRPAEPLSAVIVYAQSNWDDPYTETERSYRVHSDCWGFMEGKISSAVYGNCLDGKDIGVRLDWYRWKVEYCYLEGKVSA
jgi:hypothetical protein